MKINKNDKGKSGIYAIVNKINNKIYIGKSINIGERISAHISYLNTKNLKYENEHLINSWHKHKRENFTYIVLEYCNVEELSEKELYYILKYNSTNRQYGYNFRVDTSGGMIPLESTRKKYSEAQKKRWIDEKVREEYGKK